MKNIIKYYWIALIVIIMSIPAPAMAQITTPAETRKQAQEAIKVDQKKEKARRKETQKAKQETEENNEGFLAEKITKKRNGKRSKPVKESRRRGAE